MKFDQDYDIVFAGHVAKDTIITPDNTTYRMGGAVYYGAFPALYTGVKVGVITKIAEKDKDMLSEFDDFGIDTCAIPSPNSTEIELQYLTENLDHRDLFVTSVADPFTMDELNKINTQILSLCPLMVGEMEESLIIELGKKYKISLDIQGFLRAVTGKELLPVDWVNFEKVLSAVTYIKTDQVEANLLLGTTDIEKAVRQISDLGPSEIVLTNKEGVHVFANDQLHFQPFTAKNLSGRTGRGDTCFASYLSKRLTASVEDATKWTAEITSRKMEKPGPFVGTLKKNKN